MIIWVLQVAAREVILVGVDVASLLSEYICGCSIANIVVGASNRGVLARYFQFNDPLQVSELCWIRGF